MKTVGPAGEEWLDWTAGHESNHLVAAKAGQLFRIKDTPRALALGVAVGVFFGFVPLVGLKTLLALGVARLLRGNLLAAVIAVTLHDALLPVAPLLLRWEYDLGYWLLSHPHDLPPHLRRHHHNPLTWLHWSTFFTVGRPLLVGSLVFAAPAAVVLYYLSLLGLGRARRYSASPAESGVDGRM
jgi:uncharacterized protein (DUF2062 family)